MKTVSVVLASYNGEKYIKEQLESIINQMQSCDELIVTDDGSTDATISIVNDFTLRYPFVRLVNGPRKGYNKNFEAALFLAERDVILFSDQDDIWMPNKIAVIRKVFENDDKLLLASHDMFVMHNGEVKDDVESHPNFKKRLRKHGVLRNWVYSGYFGCCMALSKRFVKMLLPFSKHVNMYDQWIGLIAERYKSSLFIEEKLIIHRLHDDNVSKKKKTPLHIFLNRWNSLLAFLEKTVSIKKQMKKEWSD